MDEHTPGPPSSHRPVDVRKHQARTERNLIIGALVLAFLVGGGLIWHFYGLGAMVAGWLVLMGGAALGGLIYGLLKLMEIWSRGSR